MEKLIIPLVLILAIALCGSAYVPEIDVETDSMIEHLTLEYSRDFMADIINAAVAGDHEAGEAAETARNAKIDALGTGHVKVAYWDLYLLAKIMRAEAGDVSEDIVFRVGEVVVNRVASPEFPGTIEAVIKQPGQYWYPSCADRFEALTLEGYEHCVRIALRLLEGERHMTSEVVFQANFPIGAIHEQIWSGYSTMYFCTGG